MHPGAEGDRGQTRIATLVVDLVASRLDEHRRPTSGGLEHRRFNHRRMRRAHRGDAGRLTADTAAAGRDKVYEARRATWLGA